MAWFVCSKWTNYGWVLVRLAARKCRCPDFGTIWNRHPYVPHIDVVLSVTHSRRYAVCQYDVGYLQWWMSRSSNGGCSVQYYFSRGTMLLSHQYCTDSRLKPLPSVGSTSQNLVRNINHCESSNGVCIHSEWSDTGLPEVCPYMDVHAAWWIRHSEKLVQLVTSQHTSWFVWLW